MNAGPSTGTLNVEELFSFAGDIRKLVNSQYIISIMKDNASQQAANKDKWINKLIDIEHYHFSGNNDRSDISYFLNLNNAQMTAQEAETISIEASQFLDDFHKTGKPVSARNLLEECRKLEGNPNYERIAKAVATSFFITSHTVNAVFDYKNTKVSAARISK